MEKLHAPITLLQAIHNSPDLRTLDILIRRSSEMLTLVTPIIPKTLRCGIKAGPTNGTTWCLLVDNSSAAFKLRQLIPQMEIILRNNNILTTIRIKILSSNAN